MNDPIQAHSTNSASSMTLTIVDTTGIQDYIFGSNSLRHNVGASWLVHWATNDAVFAELRQLVGPSKTNIDANGNLNEQQMIEKGQITAELLYAGGGNALIVFQSLILAVDFTKRLTRRVLETAPGLQLAVTHLAFDWHKESLAQKLDDLRAKANQKKGKRHHSMPLLGQAVTADCQYTGLPAVLEDARDENRRVSAEVKAKLDHFQEAEKRLRKEVGAMLRADLTFTRDFNEIGTLGESSYLAVVHIDGNGMGARFEQIAQAHQRPNQNRAYLSEIRRLSAKIKQIAQQALQNTVIELQHKIRPNAEGKLMLADKIPIHDEQLPFRPIVYGGDDVTFVCDGRLGLTLAAYYLEQMEQSLNSARHTTPKSEAGNKLYVRAGVAVVNNHYPFARAYELAEELAESAKTLIKEVSPTKYVSALDWHFAVNGLALGLETLRARDYRTPDGELTLRPILLRDDSDARTNPALAWRTWNFFQGMVENFIENDDWGERRSKTKAYGTALRAGPEAARQFLKAFLPPHIHLAAPPDEGDVAKSGWRKGDRCVHFDAVEALDFFVVLQPQDSSKGGVR